MSREIKFRAWDRFHKKWINDFYIRGDKEILVRLITENKWSFIPLSHFNLMQYTGLKDKDGKDIYEGDILSVDWGDGNVHAKVYWDSYLGSWLVEFFGNNDTDHLYEINEISKIIGNIYENQELLESNPT